jgi:hypothetical protein
MEHSDINYINMLREQAEMVEQAPKYLDGIVDNVVNYINKLKKEIKECKKIHKKILKKNCCDDIKLNEIVHDVNLYNDISRIEIKTFLKIIYTLIDLFEKILKYIEKLNQILEQCRKNIFDEINKLKTNCDNLIKTIKETISKLSSDKIKEDKNNKLQIIINDHNYDDDFSKSVENYNKLNDIYNRLEQFNIEEFGKVKVYVKLRPNIEPKSDGSYIKYNNIIDIDEENKMLKIKCKESEKEYGAFKDICYKEVNVSDSGSNEDLFNKMKDNFTWDKIKNNTTILFSYGISGSGKSYTLFNDKDKKDKGLIYHIIDESFGYSDNKSKDIGSKYNISIHEIFEHKFIDEGLIDINGTVITFKPEKLKGKKEIIDKTEFTDVTKINDIMKKISELRTKKQTIKHTPNNSTSSRSHLFVVLKIENDKDKQFGYVVICDSAGRESPIEIARSYYSSEKATNSQIFQGDNKIGSASYMNINLSKLSPELRKICNTKNCETYKSQKEKDKNLNIGKIEKDNFENIKKISEYIQNVVKEGFFINETLNHMVKYLDDNIKRENICSTKLCKVDDYNLHEEVKDTVYTFQEPPTRGETDNIGTYKIFDELKALTGNKYRFIMVANSRTEEEKCNNIQTTFDFINKIKST